MWRFVTIDIDCVANVSVGIDIYRCCFVALLSVLLELKPSVKTHEPLGMYVPEEKTEIIHISEG